MSKKEWNGYIESSISSSPLATVDLTPESSYTKIKRYNTATIMIIYIIINNIKIAPFPFPHFSCIFTRHTRNTGGG
jgi:hypothetical protein